MTQWFGQSWGAPINQSTRHVATPVGVSCVECGSTIQDGDQGVVLPRIHYDEEGDLVPGQSAFHRACFMSAVGIGGLPE